MKALKWTIFILTLALSFEGFASAQKLGYSGRFANADGSPVQGPVNVTVEILTGTQGSEVSRCMSFINGLSLSNGVFNVELDFATTCDSDTKTLAEVLKPAFTDATAEPAWIRLTTTSTSPAVVYGPNPIYATPIAIHALSIPDIEDQSIEDTKLKGISANCTSGQILQADGSGGFSCVAAPSGGPGSSGDITAILAGVGLSVTGGDSGDATISHADNSTVSDSTNSDGVVIQSLGFDDFGHVDNISTLDLDNRYLQEIAAEAVDDLKLKGISSSCSAGQMLEADGSGGFSCVAAPSGGGGGGSYLPLAGGTLSGDLNLGGSSLLNGLTGNFQSLSLTSGAGTVSATGTISTTAGDITTSTGSISTTDGTISTTNGNITASNGEISAGTITSSGNSNAVAFLYTSDKRLKKQIKDIHGQEALRLIRELQGVHFNWKKDGKKDIGFIAQEVQEVVPELVQKVHKGENSHLAVQYGNIVAIAVEALKEQDRKIERLETENKEIKKKLDLILRKLEQKEE